MRHGGPDNHTRAEHDKHPPVPNRLVVAWACSEFVVCGEDLNED
jgi:hypothetical protein